MPQPLPPVSADAAPAVPRRRLLLSGLGGMAAAGLAAGPARSAAPAPAGAVPPLTAQTTEGPYYFDAGLVRADITEGLAGIPLDIAFTVLQPGGQPWAGARVDVWHCNAAGVYSGYDHQGDDGRTSTVGQHFLRGTQHADGQGQVAFHSVYPGWYRGRTTHIHFKVLHPQSGVAVLTCQFFLPDALSEYLYTQLPAYRRQALRDTLNRTDGIALQAGSTALGQAREQQDRYVAQLTVVADPAAHPVVDRPPVPGADGRPPLPPPGGRPPRGMPPGAGPGMSGGPGMPPPPHAVLDEAQRRQALVPPLRTDRFTGR